MYERLKIGLLKRLRLRESWIIFFVLGLVMMNYPFVHIFNRAASIGPFPLLYLYLHIGWGVSILVIYLFIKAADLPDDGDDGEGT